MCQITLYVNNLYFQGDSRFVPEGLNLYKEDCSVMQIQFARTQIVRQRSGTRHPQISSRTIQQVIVQLTCVMGFAKRAQNKLAVH